MATQAFFSFVYDLGFTPANSTTVYPTSTAQNSFLEDNSDGLDDGQTANNASAFYDVAGYAVAIDGITSNGDPIVQYNGRNLILSNSENLTGNIGFVDNGAFIYCFLTGTSISTPNGEKRIEELSSGDEILTLDNSVVAIKWIGQQKVMTRFRMPERVRPVCITQGAFGRNLPKRDLYVTPDHALFFDDVLINASALINGDTIYFVPLADFGASYTVYHIETENHEIIFAEGVPAETFIDYGLRSAFDNYDEYEALNEAGAPIAELPYPRISTARLVPNEIKHLIDRRRVA